MTDRATYTMRVHRLSYPELWRLGNGLFGFLLLLQVKWFKLAKFDVTNTTSFRPVLLTGAVPLPVALQAALARARRDFAAAGFRDLGLDDETLRAGGCIAHFARGPVVGLSVVYTRLKYTALYSFPPDAQRVVTATGVGYIDNSALYTVELMPRATLPQLLARHTARLAGRALPDLTDAMIHDHLEQLARDARALQVQRGVFVEQELTPPLLPMT
jgi:hypothetical protein